MLSDRDYYRDPRTGERRMRNSGFSAVTTIILINILLFFASTLNPAIIDLFAVDAQRPLELWRIFTYQFFHANFGHIFWNMYGVWIFGRLLEQILGKTRFLILYLFSGVLGGVFFLLVNHGTPAACIGASGAEFGVMVATAVAFPRAEFFLIFPPMRIKLWVLALVYCGLELLYETGGLNGGVAHIAHLGGALGGFLFMRHLIREARKNTRRPRNDDRGGYSRWQAPPPPPRQPQNVPPEVLDPSEPFVFDKEELNRILDKVSRQGEGQLTPREHWYLRKAAEELKKD